MSAYVPDFKHDIFVIYVHDDNAPYADTGWVTALIARVKTLGLFAVHE